MRRYKEDSMRGAGSRVLYTGKGEGMTDMLMELLQEHYEQSKCPPLTNEFAAELERFQPQAVIICLEEETPSSLQAFRILTREEQFENTAVVVISNEEADCALFAQLLPLKRLTLLPCPTDIMEIMERVQDAVAPPPVNFGVPVSEPVKEAEAETAPPAPTPLTPQAAPAADRKTSILVVDDDVMMLNTIKAFLQDLYEVTVVPNGKLALKYLEKKQADLVLLDYMMPEMDGPTVLKKIREESPCSQVPVLFLTGVAERDCVMRGLTHRPDGYLLKPTTRELLLERVMELLLGL